MWTTGEMFGIYYEVKHFKEGSVFGINEGRVSKLYMKRRNGNVFCCYDRGWGIEPDPKDVEAYSLYKMLLNSFN